MLNFWNKFSFFLGEEKHDMIISVEVKTNERSVGNKKQETKKKEKGLLVHAYNPNYSGGRSRRIKSSKPD
jgi:hypothetical protein